VSDIQKRLYEFNARLESLIGGREFTYKPDQSLIEYLKEDRRILLERHDDEVHLLQNTILELQRQCSIIEARSRDFPMISKPTSSKTEVRTTVKLSAEQEKLYRDQLNFFKDKNKELESRVDELLKINNDLKNRLDEMIRGSGHSSIACYKEEISLMHTTIEDLNLKIKKLTEENRNLKININEV